MVEHALAIQTGIWGGVGNLVVPLELSDEEIFWRLLDLYDPDIVALHAPTFDDARILAPSQHEATIATHTDGWLAAEIEPEQVEAAVEDLGNQAFWSVYELPSELSDRLVDRVAPLHHRRHLNVTIVDGSSPAHSPLTDVSRIRKLPKDVSGFTAADPLRRLLLTHQYGRVLPSLTARVTTHVAEKLLETDAEIATRLWPTRLHQPPPWQLSEGEGLARRLVFMQGGPVVVVGDEPLDFLLFHGLTRVRPAVYWLPAMLTDSEIFTRSAHLGVSADSSIGLDSDRVSITSATSVGAAEMLVERWKELDRGGRPSNAAVVPWHETLPAVPRTLADQQSERAAALICHAGETTELPAVYPMALSPESPLGLGWMVDVEVRGWTPVRHEANGAATLRLGWGGSRDVRTSLFGASYSGQSGFIPAGTSLEATAARPTLAPAGIVDQVRRVLPQGWDIGLSDKGAYALESARIFGGVQGLAAALRDPATRAVLDLFVRPKDTPGVGDWLADPRRWYVTLRQLRELIGERAEAVLEDLYEREALHRGHALKCSYCRATAFYALDTEQRFECVRCRRDQRATKFSWWSKPEPVFRYGLAEVVYLFLVNNGHVPLLATHEHFGDAGHGRDRRPLDVAFEVEVSSPGRDNPSEHDILASHGAQLWIGEASHKAAFARNLEKEEERMQRLVEVTKTMHARGILLVTTAEKLARRTMTSLTHAVDDNWINIEVIEGFDAGPRRDAD